MEEAKAYKAQLTELLATYKGQEQSEDVAAKIDAVNKAIADADAALEYFTASAVAEVEAEAENAPTYEVAPAERQFVHVEVVSSGDKFDPRTGERVSKPCVHKFSYGEWLNFKKHHKGLGLEIVTVLHNPFKGI